MNHMNEVLPQQSAMSKSHYSLHSSSQNLKDNKLPSHWLQTIDKHMKMK